MTDAHDEYEHQLESARLALGRGDRAAAEEMLSAAIETTRGDSNLHREHADVLIRLGTLKQELGQPAQAERLLTEALTVGERHAGADQTELVVALNELARFHLRQGAHARAEPLLVRLLDIKRTKGEDHPEVATVLVGLAVVRQGLGDYASTEKLYRRALEIREKSLAPNHIAVATTLEHLGEVCAARGKRGEALQHFQRALPMRERAVGVTHASVRKSRERIADLELQVSEDSDGDVIEAPVRRANPVPSNASSPPPRIILPPDPSQPRMTPLYVQRFSDKTPRSAVDAPTARVVPEAPVRAPTPPPRAPEPAPTVMAAPPRITPESTPFVTPESMPRVTPESTPRLAPEPAPRAAAEFAPKPTPMFSEIFKTPGTTTTAVPDDPPDREPASQPWMGGLVAVQEELRHMERPGVSTRALTVMESLPLILEKRSTKIGTAVAAGVGVIAAAFAFNSFKGGSNENGVTQAGSANPPLAAVAAAAGAATPVVTNAATAPLNSAPAARTDSSRVATRTVASAPTTPKETAPPAAPAASAKLPGIAGLNISSSVLSNMDSLGRAANATPRAARESADAIFTSSRLNTSAYASEAGATVPTLIGRMPQPAYPEQLRKRRLEGEVVVEFQVDENGRVDASTMKVIRTPHDQFSLAVQRVLPQFRFEPARTAAPQSKPRSEWVQYSFLFNVAK